MKAARIEPVPLGEMLADAFVRLGDVARRMQRHDGPPPAPLPVERAAARREAIIPPRVRLDLQLDRIDRGWGLP